MFNKKELASMRKKELNIMIGKLNADIRELMSAQTKPKVDYGHFSKADLISLIEHQTQEIIKLEAIASRYEKQLERVIEYNAVENYRNTVQRNRERRKNEKNSIYC